MTLWMCQHEETALIPGNSITTAVSVSALSGRPAQIHQEGEWLHTHAPRRSLGLQASSLARPFNHGGREPPSCAGDRCLLTVTPTAPEPGTARVFSSERIVSVVRIWPPPSPSQSCKGASARDMPVESTSTLKTYPRSTRFRSCGAGRTHADADRLPRQCPIPELWGWPNPCRC